MYKLKAKHSAAQWLVAATLLASALFTGCSSAKQTETDNSIKRTKANYRSAFDFVPGNKVLWHESFSATSAGSFPKGWNTNASAEVVQENNNTHALLLTRDGVYIPTVVNFPETFTLQFTLSCSADYSYYSSPLQIMFAALSSKKEFTVLKQYNPHNKDVVKLTLHPMNAAAKAGSSTIELIEKGTRQSTNEIGINEFFAGGGPATVKVSIWRQGERLRVYLNKEKVWDLPQAFSQTAHYNSLIFGISHLTDKGGKYYLSDIILATDETNAAAQPKIIK